MSFKQFKLDRSILQSRDIFNKYIYETEDTIAETLVVDYFEASRFKEIDNPDTNGMGWIGGIIEAQCLDGYYIGEIQADGSTAVIVVSSSSVDQLTKEVTVDGGTYTVDGTEGRIWALNSPTITFPQANTVTFHNIPIRTLSGTTTLAAIVSSIEVTSIPNGSSVVIGQRAATDEWLQII